jgi:long-subunit fatty acid transport protein
MKPVRARRPSSFLSTLAGGALALTALSSTSAQAAAYYAGEIGARSVARGGANLVNPGDPSAVWLNPAAVTLSPGVQLQLDFNLVFLTSEFVRDCGGEDNGCAVLQDIERSYNDPATGQADPARAVRLTRGGRQLSDNVAPAEPGQLGARGTPSRFDGTSTTVRNEAGPQPIPRLMATFHGDTFGVPGVALGVYAYAPSSGDYRFGQEAATRYTLIDRDLLEVFYGLTVGYRYGDWIAVGASLQGVTAGLDQSLRLGIDKFGNEDPGYDVQVRVTGYQHLIPSGNIGVWSSPLKPLGIDLQLGASVQLPRQVKATGPLKIEKIGDKAQADFFEAAPGGQPVATLSDDGATATAEFTLPPFWRIGAKYTNDDVLKSGARIVGIDLEVDGVLEQWSTYDHVFLTTKDLTFSSLGAEPEPLPPIVQPKDWVDAFSVRAGGTVSFFDRILELHGGAFYETSAVPNATHTIEVVDGDKVGVGTGVSARMWGVRLDVAYGHIFYFDRVIGQESIVTAGNVAPAAITGGNDPVTRVAMGTYRAGLDELNIGLTVAFDELFGFGAHAPPPVVPVVTPPPVEAASPESAAPAEPTPSVAPPSGGEGAAGDPAGGTALRGA